MPHLAPVLYPSEELRSPSPQSREHQPFLPETKPQPLLRKLGLSTA